MLGLFLTLIKPFNITLILWGVLSGKNEIAAVAIMWFMVCDMFDGFFFRRSPLALRKSLLWLRRVFNVIGDRVAVHTVLITMVVVSGFPLYLYLVGMSREISLFGVWAYGYQLRKPLRKPNLFSQVSAFSVGSMAATWLVFPEAAAWLLIPVVGFGIPAVLRYHQTIKALGAR